MRTRGNEVNLGWGMLFDRERYGTEPSVQTRIVNVRVAL